MNSLDDLLAATPASPETARTAVSSDRKCRRHEWATITVAYFDGNGDPLPSPVVCIRCHVTRDPVKSRRGKSSARLGKDQERRAEKRYGWEKIGERGEKTDLRGRFAKVQQKATRRAPPVLFRDVFAGLDATRDGRVPLLLLTYIRQGLPAEDYIVMRGETWLELHGRDEEP